MDMTGHDEVLDSFEMKSPQQLLAGLDYQLVAEFFAVFSRVEHALKMSGYLQEREPATVDWHRFASEMVGQLSSVRSIKLKTSIVFLTDFPPKKQLRNFEWQDSPFPEICSDRDSKAIIASTRVRNNLFHGGKYNITDPARDTELIVSALNVLRGCLYVREDIKTNYELVL
ncbi:hypothetical protein QMZ30_14685 [Pantoea sp. EA-12]|uniref:hypothetical protein n=1 Tax=Pantoea sp. EA-12 TaxID=3043303 RepID=UPI0024B632A7|nr:hypothetical protein [Pantoea sp. EA-12]MDI9222149.1 hypothetical protein [Pantoea sp. EA-12]